MRTVAADAGRRQFGQLRRVGGADDDPQDDLKVISDIPR